MIKINFYTVNINDNLVICKSNKSRLKYDERSTKEKQKFKKNSDKKFEEFLNENIEKTNSKH